MNSIQTIVALVFTPTASVAVLAYFGRSMFERLLQRDITTYKARLDAELALAKATFDTQIQAQLFEHQTRFSNFHAEQAKIIGELYSKLDDALSSVERLVQQFDSASDGTADERRKATAETFNDFAIYFRMSTAGVKSP